MNSIRRRTVGVVLGLFMLAWVLMAAWTWDRSRHEIEEVFDAQLAQASLVLMEMAWHDIGEMHQTTTIDSELMGLKQAHHYEQKLAFQVWKGAELRFRSESAPHQPMVSVAGYSEGVLQDERWRFLLRQSPDASVQVIVGARHDVRDEMIYNLNWQTVLPMLVILPLLAITVTLGIGRSLAPLMRLTRQIRNRSSMDLQPVEMQAVPLEIRDLVMALNALLARLQDAFQGERRFTADAAHELRTPLAVIRAQAQLAQRLDDAAEREQAMQGVVAGVDRATRLVSQMLTLARVDSAPLLKDYAPIDLSVLIETEATTLRERLPATGPQLLTELQAVKVQGSPELLAVLLRNLVENALRHAQDAQRIVIRLERGAGEASLVVEDDGAGIACEQLQRVQQRFYRAPGAGAEGCGLGLSIVSRICELHDAEFTLDNVSPHGLQARIRFFTEKKSPALDDGIH